MSDKVVANTGVIEGFFGRPWTWEERKEYATFLKEVGYHFYIYAPKGDGYLRRQWQASWPSETQSELRQLVDAYHKQELSFGFGLSPYELYLNYDSGAREQLRKKVEELNTFAPDILCILFDDMKGDVPGLAKLQADIVHEIRELSDSKHLIMCPSYYTFDPILEKVFGKMPEDYFASLGEHIDKDIDIFWTGPKVCSTDYPVSHLKEVSELLQRKPFLWDNYPVNDGARMSRFLHLSGFEGRSHSLAEWTSGHAVNPMNQPWLSRIPLRTLMDSYRQKDIYQAHPSFEQACKTCCGEELGSLIVEDLIYFHGQGLDKMGDTIRETLKERYQPFSEVPFAQEILGWLREEYKFDPACLTD